MNTKPVVIGFTGKSGSGKTTLITSIIPVLIKKGYRIGTIKHNFHGFEIDYPGKDSYKHRQAGSLTTILSSPNQLAMIKTVEKDLPVSEIIKYMEDLDLVIVEGHKTEDFPKIEVFRKEHSEKPLCETQDLNVIAIATTSEVSTDLPLLDLNDYEAAAEFIIEKFL